MDSILYVLKKFITSGHLFLRKRVLITSMTIITLVVLAVPTVYLLNIINGSKDYKSVLAVQADSKANQRLQAVFDEIYSKDDCVNQPQKNITGNRPEDGAESAANQLLITPAVNMNENGTDADQIKKPHCNVINILLLGIDRTEERDVSIGVSRSDTIAIASINLDTKKVNVLCIPRDTYTFIPVENKNDKINHAYAFGTLEGEAIKGSIDAVEKFIKYAGIDYYFAIDMQPIPEIIDKLGGVEVDVDFEIINELRKGRQLLDGQKAFKYIRFRDTPNGDIDRIIHQQKFTRAMLAKLKDSGELMNAFSIVLNYRQFIKTNMGFKQMAAFARLWEDIPSGNSSYYIIPGEDRIIDEIWYYIPDAAETEVMLKKVFIGENE